MTSSTVWRGLYIEYRYDPGEPSRRGVYQEDGDPGCPPSVDILDVTINDPVAHHELNDEGWTPEVYVDLHHDDFLDHVIEMEDA